MKSINKIFIFGHCRNMLGRLLPHDLKTLRFLPVRVSTDFDESHKPFQALYNNRQARNVFDNFHGPSNIATAPISGVVVINTLKGPFPDEGSGKLSLLVGDNTNKQGGATSSLKLSDTTSDRLRSLKKGLYSLFGGRGYKLLFFRSSTSFHPAGLN